MYISIDILRFYTYITCNISCVKVNILKPEFAFVFFNAKRDGLVTKSTSNELLFESCNRMKKIPSCHKGMSKLSKSYNKFLGLTQVNFHFYTGSTLPQRDNDMLRECIVSFFDSGFR